MLVKLGKVVQLKGEQQTVFLRRISDKEYPNACIACSKFHKKKECKYSDLDCAFYDTQNYSYVVRKIKKWKKKVVK